MKGKWVACAVKRITCGKQCPRRRMEAELEALAKFSHLRNTLMLVAYKWEGDTVHIVTRQVQDLSHQPMITESLLKCEI